MKQDGYKNAAIVTKRVDPPDGDLIEWLQAQEVELIWLLAHTYSGVVWGKFFDGAWQLSSGLIDESPPLEPDTLLQLRAFSDKHEVFVWRDGDALLARVFSEPDGLTELAKEGAAVGDYYDEPQILWGTHGVKLNDAFTLVWDGRQGMRHAVPLQIPETAFGTTQKPYRPLRLTVRHYLGRHKETGLAGICLSRLVDLTWKPQQSNNQESA